MEALNFNQNLNVKYVVLLLLCSSLTSFASAQNIDLSDSTSTAVIVLKDEVKIYSTDLAFNSYLLSRDLISENPAYISKLQHPQQDVENRLAENNAPSRNDPGQQLNFEKQKRHNVTSEKVKKQISIHKKRTIGFLQKKFGKTPSKDYFFCSVLSFKNYVLPSNNNINFTKDAFTEESYLLSQSLDYLYTTIFYDHKSQSLDCFFSEIFSVRPPPYFS